jgi:hypothetical protein
MSFCLFAFVKKSVSSQRFWMISLRVKEERMTALRDE